MECSLRITTYPEEEGNQVAGCINLTQDRNTWECFCDLPLLYMNLSRVCSNARKICRDNWLTVGLYDREVPRFVPGCGVDCSSKAGLANMRPATKVPSPE